MSRLEPLTQLPKAGAINFEKNSKVATGKTGLRRFMFGDGANAERALGEFSVRKRRDQVRMTSFQLSAGLLGIIVAGCVSAPAPAYAGEWRFYPERCPDLVEDWRDRRESRLDERYDTGPRDRAEDRRDRQESRRDERVTVCPANAWGWDGPGRYRTARPAAVPVYYDPYDRHYYRYRPDRARIRVVVR